MSFFKENWRELVGWILIAYLFLVFHGMGHYPFRNVVGDVDTFETFEAIAFLVVLILSWLRINKK